MKLRSRFTVATIAVVTVFLGGCAAGQTATSSPGATAQIKVGVTPIGNAAPLYLGIEKGFFADENLDVEPSIIQSPAATIPSLINGELQFALVSPIPTITAASKGLPIQIAVGNDHYTSDPDSDQGAAILASAHSGITSAAGLAGKTIAVVGLKSGPELTVRLALKAEGVDASTVSFVEIAYPDMAAALQNDRVDAALIVDPFLAQAKAAGLTQIMQPYGIGLPGRTSVGWISSSTYLTSNSDAAKRFRTAMEKSVQYAADHPDEVRDIIGTYTQLSDEARKKMVLPLFNSAVDQGDLQFYADAMLEQGFINSSFDASGLLWQP